MSKPMIERWKTLEEEYHSWTQDNYGLEQTVSLQENSKGRRRLKLYRHDDTDMTILPLLSGKGTLVGLDKLPHRKYERIMEGDGYGGDLLEIAEAAKMDFNKDDLQKSVELIFDLEG